MKKLPTLHILNGDASLPAFKAAGLPGQVLVWREVLSEGPCLASLPEHEFWQKRQSFISQNYQEAAAAYKEKVLDELPKLYAAGAFFEVVLWFDADLMCQVNLLYLLQRLHQLQPNFIYTCIPPLPQSIALLQPEELQQLFDNRHQQTPAQLKQAHEVWQLYAGPDPMQLQDYLQQNTLYSPHLRYGIELHLSRFSDCRNGLSYPENVLLQLIQEGTKTKEQLLQQFREQHPGYGFGDVQLLQLLKRLQPELVPDGDSFTITPFGERVLQKKEAYKPKQHWLGGAKIDAVMVPCYNPLTGELQKFPPA